MIKKMKLLIIVVALTTIYAMSHRNESRNMRTVEMSMKSERSEAQEKMIFSNASQQAIAKLKDIQQKDVVTTWWRMEFSWDLANFSVKKGDTTSTSKEARM